LGKRNGSAEKDGSRVLAWGFARRMVVMYRDGSWTDNLAVAHYGLDSGPPEMMLTIDVAARERAGKVRAARRALREFIKKRRRIHSIQIGKPKVASQLHAWIKDLEQAQIGVKLCVEGSSVIYPAAVVFGPDAVTLDLG
jgi:hypothetical protein